MVNVDGEKSNNMKTSQEWKAYINSRPLIEQIAWQEIIEVEIAKAKAAILKEEQFKQAQLVNNKTEAANKMAEKIHNIMYHNGGK